MRPCSERRSGQHIPFRYGAALLVTGLWEPCTYRRRRRRWPSRQQILTTCWSILAEDEDEAGRQPRQPREGRR